MADDWATADDAPAPGYMSQDDFKSTMDSVYGAGQWQQTGGWRSQQREAQLRQQGAATVPTGSISQHSMGTDDAPGAYDITVNGMTPQQAAAKLRAAQVPVSTLLPEDAAGGQGAHLHVGMPQGVTQDPWATANDAAPAGTPPDPWATANDAAPAPVSPAAKHGFRDSASRFVGSVVGGAEEAAASAVAGGGKLLDILAQEQAREYASGVGPGGLPVPEASRAAAEKAAAAPRAFAQKATDPWATALDIQAAKTEPADRSWLEGVAHGAGGFVPLIAAGAVNPALGIAAFGAGGYQQGEEEAARAGASPEVAERAGLESAGLQAGVGMIPFGKALEPVVGKIGGKLLAPLARTGAEVVGGGVAGAGIQTGENVIAQRNYDPNRPTFQNVPEAALEMGLGAGAVHAVGEAGGAIKTALRPREQPVTPAPEQAAAAAQQAMPETVAAQAYRDMVAARAAPAPEEPSTWTPEREAAYQQAVERGDYARAEAVQAEAAPAAKPPNPIPTRPPADYEAARIAEGAPPEQMPSAIADVAELKKAAPKGYNLFQAMRDLGGIQVKDADGNVDGDVQQALGGSRMPGLINNKSGLTPDAMREALQEGGWFGSFDQSQGAADTGSPPPGSNIQDLFDLMDRHVRNGPVRHPAAENQEHLARRAELETEMAQAGVAVKDAPAVAAAKLAAWRGDLAKESGPEMEALQARAAALGVAHAPGMGYEELLGDVLEREAIQSVHDGAEDDHSEHLIDAELTPEEHEWLSSSRGSGEGEQESAGGLAEAARGAAPESRTPGEDRAPGARAGGGGAQPHEVAGLPELVAVDPNAVVDAWEKGWGPFRDRHAEVQDAMDHGRQILIPRETYEREVGGTPFEAHLRHNSEFEGVPDPWAIASAGTERRNLGHETVDQGLFGGMEQSARQAAAARGEGPIKARVPQKDAGGLFAAPEDRPTDLFAPQKPEAPKPPPETAATPEAKEAAAKAATPKGEGYGEKNKLVTREAYEAARARLRAKLNNQLNSGIDPDLIYDGVQMAVFHVEAGARKFGDFAENMLADLGEKARPYLKMWYNAIRDYPGMDGSGMTANDAITQDVIDKVGRDVFGSSPDLERGGEVGAAENGDGAQALSPEPGGAERGPEQAGGGAGGPGGPGQGGGGLFDRGAAPVGESGPGGVREVAPGGAGRAAVGGKPGGGDPARDAGIQPDRIPAKDVGAAAVENAHLKPVPADAHPFAESTNAPPVSSELERALPTLFPEQRGDVAFAEKRFAAKDGHGVLFTNGTGTGKTFTGGGIAKRFYDAGKKNILVVAPSQGILAHWVEAMHKLGVPFKLLEDTSRSGSGPVGTTYAALTSNRTLADRSWDLVIADEAHTLSSDANGSETTALKAFRAITNHPDRLRLRAEMQLRADADMVERLWKAMGDSWDGPEFEAWKKAQGALDEKIKGLVEQFKTEPRTKAAFLSATPFAYDKSIDYANGYLFDYGPQPQSNGYNTGSAKDQFMMRHFGYHMRYNKLTKPEASVESDVMERQFHEWMRRQGALSGRVLNVDKDYDRKFALVDNGVGRKIDQALDFLNTADDGKFRNLAEAIGKRFDYLSRARLLEAIKAKEAIPLIRAHQALGRKVVVFHNYNEGGGFSPFELEPDMDMYSRSPGEISELHAEFVARNPYVATLNAEMNGLAAPIHQLLKAFPGALLYNGTVSKGQREAAKQLFNRDGSGRDLIIIQSDAGQAGISLHDTTGAHQRVLMNLGMPGRPVAAIQQEGRIYRLGQASDAIFRYLNTGTNWERRAFAQTIAQRAGTAENLALGEQSRALRESFINAFLDSAHYLPEPGEGKGGKQADFTLAKAVSEFQKAKSFYFAEAKKTGNRASREGADYYATPEPLGLKMTEWADIRPGDKVLEPSAGHGAIARFFPETADRTLVEPAPGLASRAELSAPGARVLNQRFEDLHPVNKYDAIVMNPPFGHAGATAIDHVAKAATHLRDGGRIVALIPRGAADAKLEKFLESPAGKQIYKAADIDLPPSTFERAGTAVRTRVVVLERHEKPDNAPQPVTRDFSNAANISELFDRIEDSSIPARRVVRPIEEQPQPTPVATRVPAAPPPGSTKPAARFITAETVHGKTGEPLYVATNSERVSSDDYKATLALAKAQGGWYSSFRGSGAIPGFQFTSAAARQAFMDAAAAAGVTPATKFQRPTFYSPAERAVAASSLQSASADQWESTIRNTPGVKKEELEWLGLSDWLHMFGDEKVPKSAVQAFLRDNGVQVQERLLGAPIHEWTASELEKWESANDTVRRAQGEVQRLHRRSNVERMGTGAAAEEQRAYEQERTAIAAREALLEEIVGPQHDPQFDDWKLPGGEDYHELLFTLPKIEQPPATHWDTPGVMAHVRFNTRRDVDGKKVLFIEEVQSDWHQKGRDQGYAQPADRKLVAAAEARYRAAGQHLIAATSTEGARIRQWLRGAGVDERFIPQLDTPEDVRRATGALYAARDYDKWKEAAPEAHAAFAEAHNETVGARLAYTEARQHAQSLKGTSGIANAPFKSSWPALVMKRMILWAADHGFDRVAWTTGDQQADRYDLTKHIKRIDLHDNWPGGLGRADLEGPFTHGMVIAEAPDGSQVLRQHVGSEKELRDLIGNELADRLLSAEARLGSESGMQRRARTLDGLDLKLGGEGMRAFYDRNLVNITNDLVKKYGAKVGEHRVLTADFRDLEHFAESDNGAWRMAEERADRHADNVGLEPRLRESAARAKAAAEQSAARLEEARRGSPQPGFDITDKMREAAKEGLPLFRPGDENVPGNVPGTFQPITRGLRGEDASAAEIPPERVAALIKQVRDIVQRIAPAAEPRAYARLQDEAAKAVEGAMFPQGAGHVIAWALDAADHARTARHEAVHALRAAGLFKPAEWSALSSEALRSGWLDHYKIATRYSDLSPERQIEEAIAERYADWRKDIEVTDIPSFVRSLFQRIKEALRHVGDAVHAALGHDVSADAVMRAIERGAVGRRQPEAAPAPQPAPQPVRYQTPAEEKRTEGVRAFVNKALGVGLDAVGHKISDISARVLPDPLLDLGHAIRMGLNPMAAGSGRAQAAAKDFANAWREHGWEWGRVDRWLEKTFTPEQRQKMWSAADEESVIRQKGGEPRPNEGLNRLEPAERAAVEELQKRADKAFNDAKTLGMTKAVGLASYVPRMVVEMTAGGGARRVRPTGEQGAASGGVGRNLKTGSAQLRHRKYLETSETEAAARKAFGEGAVVVKDIRTLALATAKLEQAVAGRRLVDQIKEMGKSVGEQLVTEGAAQDPHAAFTLDHPALRTWAPKLVVDPATGKMTTIEDPSTGRPVMEAHPLYIAKEFEGPLKAVLTQAPGKVEGALMTLKGKIMSVVMYSPLMHNAVIWGKAIPAAPKAVLGFSVYRKGYLAKTEPATMREAIRAGLDPIGKRYFNQDITAIAAPPQIEPGQSWTAKFLAAAAAAPPRVAGAAVKPFNADLGKDLADRGNALSRATKEGIDRLGNLWHNTFLWDRVGDLQMGIYTILRDSFVKHGLDPQTAQRVAAHYANRYAGALPMEAMSKLARNTANVALFSRSFTLTNLGAWKDAIAGLPTDVQAQIMRDKGFAELKQAQGTARGKAMAMIVMDAALAHVGLILASGAVWGVHHMLGNQSFNYQDPNQNEKGKENRVLLGYQSDGTALYGRLPTGKVAEDLLSWITEPVSTSEHKLSPFGKVALEVASNDKGFGRKLYDPYDKTPLGFPRNVGRVVLGADLANLHSPDDFTGGLLGSMTPVGLIQGLAHLGNKSTDQRTAALEATLPLFGITVSKGAPGGPAMGDLFRAQDEHEFQVAEKLPGIRQDIKAGKLAEARQAMTRLGIAPGLQAYYVRTTMNPAQRLTGRKLRDFLQYATPEDRVAFQQDQAASVTRHAEVAP